MLDRKPSCSNTVAIAWQLCGCDVVLSRPDMLFDVMDPPTPNIGVRFVAAYVNIWPNLSLACATVSRIPTLAGSWMLALRMSAVLA
jgi:hypothetical protein